MDAHDGPDASLEREVDARIRELYRERFGHEPDEVRPVAADASSRRYVRLLCAGSPPVIGAHGPEPEENRAFLHFSRAFREIELPVPEIYAADPEGGVWLEEDLGTTTLFDLVANRRGEAHRGGADAPPGDGFPTSLVPLYRKVLGVLPLFQIRGARVVDFDLAYPRAAFDRQSILWDLNYFKYHFLKLAHIPFNEGRLERDFDRLARFLLRADRRWFLYRDFQSRNIMVRDGEPWFIDYQGGRQGALQYDVASLLYDAKADLSEPLRGELLEHYLDALEEHLEVDRELFRERYRGYVLIRIMQAMGAYGYRGFFERKPHFLQSVPYAARNLETILARGLPIRVPEIEAVLERIAEQWGPEPAPAPGVAEAAESSVGARTVPEDASGLVVRIASFSYRGGYPPDRAGHGGGFVFDCRAIPNPGRDAAFREVTGRDDEVVRWLEGREETGAFWDSVRALVDAQVRRYLERGFTSLSVGFGCTGGQHRSPYFAERLARHLRSRFPEVDVWVEHREETSWPSRTTPPAGA